TSASVKAGSPLRLRRACSAAIEDLLHFLHSATHFATSALMGPLAVAAGAVVTGGGAADAGGAPASKGSPRRADASASVSGGSPLRPRRACSAAIADLLHFFPSATHLATSSLITPEAGAEAEAAAGGADSAGAAGTDVATVVAVELPPSPRSHGIGSPAFSASISVSLRRGRPFL